MIITNREITKSELDEIYADFKKIETQDGVPPFEQKRYNITAEENGMVVGFASGLTNHKWFVLTDLWVHEGYKRKGLGTKILSMLEADVKAIGTEHIYTWTSGFTNPKFYEKQGYYAFTVFEDFFEVKGYHHIGYRKDLIDHKPTTLSANTIERKIVECPDIKTAVTKKIMHSLPAWFSPPEDIERKAVIHREYPFFTAYDDDAPIGFVALKIHNQYSADIFNIGVLEPYHRKGIGRCLLAAAERCCVDNGYLYLTVKTLDSSAEYEPYERTRKFYQKMGFISLDIFNTFWNEENPCLFMAKCLGGSIT
jgi:GNAT superfamily N-acetyltransferase